MEKFKKILSLVLVGVLLCTPTNYVYASSDNQTGVNSGNSNASAGSSGSSGWKYLNDDGYKMTTYILATTDLSYMNNLSNDLQKYIIRSRGDMYKIKKDMKKANSEVTTEKFIKKYSNTVSYFSKNDQAYLSDYYQQLGNPMSFLLTTSTGNKPGYVGMTTSPSSHLSNFEDDGYNKDSGISEGMIEKYRSEIKLVKANSCELLGNSVNLGTYCDLSSSNKWLDDVNIKDVEDISNFTGEPAFLKYAIKTSVASGLFYTGVSTNKLKKFGVTVKKVNGDVVTGQQIHITDIKMDRKELIFSMDSEELEEIATCKGYYTSGNSKIEVSFKCREINLLNAFLYRYSVNGSEYTWEDLCLTNTDKGDNYGLNVSVVVMLEPLKLQYHNGSINSSVKKDQYGEYANESRNNNRETNGLFLSIRDRAYIYGNNHQTGWELFKKQWASTGVTSNKDTFIDEKYSAGLCLNYVNGKEFGISSSGVLKHLNSMLYSDGSYCEFPAVKLVGAGSGKLCGNNKKFKYSPSDKDLIRNGGEVISDSKPTSNLVGGIACIGYYHEMDLDSGSSINPFPSLTVRHIDNTALSDSSGSENVLMRDSVTWTLPASLGLAIEHDLALATFLTENKGLHYAYGNEQDSISYADLDDYVKYTLKKTKSITTRFGNSSDEGVKGNSFAEKLKVAVDGLKQKTYKYNGVNVKTISLKQLLKGVKDLYNGTDEAFITLIKEKESGNTESKKMFYELCLDVITDYYSDYKVRIPLLRDSKSNLSTKISSDNVFWAISAKPLSTCSGSYEYYDGAIMSGESTKQREALANSINKLNEYSLTYWDTAEKRDSENGTDNEDTFGETVKFTNSELKFPSSRAISPLDYHVEYGDTEVNVPKNSKKSKFNYFYGFNFYMDRKIGSSSKYGKFKETGNKYDLYAGSLKDGTEEKDAYLPTAKITKSYTDVMFDVSSFNNAVGFMEKSYGQSISGLVDNSSQLHESNLSGIKSWAYLVFPEFSLGSRMLMGHSCTNKIVDTNVYANLENYDDTDISPKNERDTKEPLMTYWSSTKYTAPLADDINIRDNMFFGNCERGYNNVWVPDLGNNKANLNKAEIKSGSNVNGGQTATSKMFDITERIYGITLAYNPNMGSADSWTYRIGSGYEIEKSDINNNGKNAIPSSCRVNLATEGAISAQPFLDRCDKLGVKETLFEMPGEIVKLEGINRGGEKRNFVKYTDSGWKFLNGKFSSDGTAKYTALMSSNDVYTLNLSEGSEPRANYVEINVGDWISFGDLGTLDAYYDTVPTSKIYDMSLDLDTDIEGLNGFTMNELLLTDNYLIKKNRITNGYTINKASTSYDMEAKSSDRDYNPDGRKYVGTISIKGNDLELLSKTISSGDKCLSMLRSNNVLYQLEDKVVDLKAGLLALKSDEVIYYVNVWAKNAGDVEEIKGDKYIRSDELVSAAKLKVPDNSLILKAVATQDCGMPGHSNGSLDSVTWHTFRESAKNSEPWRVMSSSLGSKNPFTILGKVDEGKKYAMEWLGDSGSKWKNGYYVNSNAMTIPSGLSVGVLLHRSMQDYSSKEYSKTPPLAEYMNGTDENKKYIKLCNDYDVPYAQYSGKGYLVSDNYTGWSAKNNVRTLKFNLYNDLDISKDGDLNYFTDFDAQYSCVVGNNIVDHSGRFINENFKIKAEVEQETIKSDIAVEGVYVPNNSDSETKKPEVVTDKVAGGTDREVLYKVPTKVSFRPTFLMRADYDVNNYEVDNDKYSAAKKEGNREKVWVLGSKERTMNVYNLHSIKITGLEDVKVQAPWSTDRKDKLNYQNGSGKPTVKAGSAYKLHKSQARLKVESTVYLLDENFYSGEGLTEVKNFNAKAISDHNELVAKLKGLADGTEDAKAFSYTSLPGAYDEELAKEYPGLENKFTNVVNGKKMEYSQGDFNSVFDKTKVRTLVESGGITTTVNAVYLNKHYDDKDYTSEDYKGSRGMSINVNGKNYNINPKCLDITDDILSKTGSTEDVKCKNETFREFYRQLHSATKAGMSWYKEDFEGVIQVTISSEVLLNLDTDYSIIWDNLSDWQDRVGVKPYNVAKPELVEFDGSSSVKVIGETPNMTPKIQAGDIGAGYGFMFKDVELGGVKYGTACLLTKPYLFEVRGNVYDNISK